MASGSDIVSGGLQGGMAGAATGAKVGGPWGAVIGGVVGTIGGGILGGMKKKTRIPKFASSAVYGYDSYGNLINRGSYKYNKATKTYELSAGELSGPEKAMRQNLGRNIASLINTVGTTPDAFVRYAKELSDSYYKQGERKLTEQYEKAQGRLDESLARRGLSTSRAAADMTSELQGQRFDTLADIYDAAQRYGYDVQSGMQNQARANLGTLAGYQSGLSAVDQSYLSQALTAQQIGQAYENMKAGLKNAEIARQNENWQNVLDSMTSLGGLGGFGGFGGGQQSAQPTQSSQWMNYANQYANQNYSSPNIAGLGNTNYLNQIYGWGSSAAPGGNLNLYSASNNYGIDPSQFVNF